MTYGLPARGQADWDDELNNSVESLKALAETADRNAYSAQSNANDARSRADTALARSTASGFATDPDDPNVLIVALEGRVAADQTDPDIIVITY